MAVTDKNGVTARAHLKQAAKTLGRIPKELQGPPFPARLSHIWEMFLEVNGGRSYGMSGPNPLSWGDLKAWDDLTGTGLKSWEVRLLKSLDRVWLRVMHEGDENG